MNMAVPHIQRSIILSAWSSVEVQLYIMKVLTFRSVPEDLFRGDFSFCPSFLKKNLLQAKLQHRNFAQKLIGFPNNCDEVSPLGCNLSGKNTYRPHSHRPSYLEACDKFSSLRPRGLGTQKNSRCWQNRCAQRKASAFSSILKDRCISLPSSHAGANPEELLLLGISVINVYLSHTWLLSTCCLQWNLTFSRAYLDSWLRSRAIWLLNSL